MTIRLRPSAAAPTAARRSSPGPRAGGPAIALALVALASIPGVARAEVTLVGHGFGHGVGMPQYGARGNAEQGRDFEWILRRYYSGTRTAPTARARIRVRLKLTTAAKVSSSSLARGADGRRVALRPDRTYRFILSGDRRIRMVDLRTRRTRARLVAPVRLTSRTAMTLRGRSENAISDGRYRGALVLSRAEGRVLVVDDVDSEHYLYGVVPVEMPPSWPREALRAQAVASRSYALTSRRPVESFDVFADTRSQVYGGVGVEAPATTAAVQGTRRLAVMTGAFVARTLFHSSSGGRTAGVEEVFGGPALSYLRSVDDPADLVSPYHDWTVTLSDEVVEHRLDPVLAGRLVGLEVASRTPSGRAATVRVTGTAGVREVSATEVRRLLGLRSTWFRVMRG